MNTAPTGPSARATWRLGLVGDVGADTWPAGLFIAAARQHGLSLTCERLVPANGPQGFDAVFDQARSQGLDGLCIDGPYQAQAFARAPMPDADDRLNGLLNVVAFDADGAARGINADQSAFVSVFCERVGLRGPGTTCLVGAGRAGRAIAFALLSLGIRRLRLADTDAGRAQQLGDALRQASPRLDLLIGSDPLALIDERVEGLVNATPLGASAVPDSVLPASAFAGRRWAFDVVHDPASTRFLRDARAAGVGTISGADWSLHRYAVAFRHLTGLALAPDEWRALPATD